MPSASRESSVRGNVSFHSPARDHTTPSQPLDHSSLPQGLPGFSPHSCFPSYVLYRFSVGGLKIKQARDVLTKLERKVKLSLSLAKDTFTGGQMSSPVPLGNTGFSDAIPFIPLPILPPFFFFFISLHLFQNHSSLKRSGVWS